MTISMSLTTQESFNKSLYDHINKIADKIESGISPENLSLITDDLIDILKRSEKYDKENMPYDSMSTINSYQVREIKQIIRYLESMKVETHVMPIETTLFEKTIEFRAPEGFSAYNSYVSLDMGWTTFKSYGGNETDEGSRKTVSGNTVYITRYIDGPSSNNAMRGAFKPQRGYILFWRYV